MLTKYFSGVKEFFIFKTETLCSLSVILCNHCVLLGGPSRKITALKVSVKSKSRGIGQMLLQRSGCTDTTHRLFCLNSGCSAHFPTAYNSGFLLTKRACPLPHQLQCRQAELSLKPVTAYHSGTVTEERESLSLHVDLSIFTDSSQQVTVARSCIQGGPPPPPQSLGDAGDHPAGKQLGRKEPGVPAGH